MTFCTDFKIEGGDLAGIQQVLRVLPKRLRNGAMRRAGKQAADIVRRNVQPLVPMSKHNPNEYGPFQNDAKNRYLHLRHGIVSKVKTYTNAVFVVVGPRTNAKLFHAHLIEFGTRPRYTRHTSRYQKVGEKRIKTKSGGKVGYRTKRIRKSIGSFLDERKLKRGPVRFTGVGPAHHYMSRGWAQARPGVIATIETELRKALATSGVTV